MGIDGRQFKELIVRPILKSIDLWSETAENLLAGTAYIESELQYIKQLPDGPAVSVMQIEPNTYLDLKKRVSDKYPEIFCKIKLSLFMNKIPDTADWLIGNLNAAVIFARLKYYFDPEPLPLVDDYVGMAELYKRVYNTSNGAATLENATIAFRAATIGYVIQRVRSVKARMYEKG